MRYLPSELSSSPSQRSNSQRPEREEKGEGERIAGTTSIQMANAFNNSLLSTPQRRSSRLRERREGSATPSLAERVVIRPSSVKRQQEQHKENARSPLAFTNSLNTANPSAKKKKSNNWLSDILAPPPQTATKLSDVLTADLDETESLDLSINQEYQVQFRPPVAPTWKDRILASRPFQLLKPLLAVIITIIILPFKPFFKTRSRLLFALLVFLSSIGIGIGGLGFLKNHSTINGFQSAVQSIKSSGIHGLDYLKSKFEKSQSPPPQIEPLIIDDMKSLDDRLRILESYIPKLSSTNQAQINALTEKLNPDAIIDSIAHRIPSLVLADREFWEMINSKTVSPAQWDAYIAENKAKLMEIINNVHSTTASIMSRQEILGLLSKQQEPLADGVGKTDYALRTSGGRVIDSSGTYCAKGRNWMGMCKGWGRPAKFAIMKEVGEGECWAMDGNKGFIKLHLSKPINITSITLQHLHPSLAQKDTYKNTPRLVRVLEEEVQIGEFEYSLNSTPIQSFSVGGTRKTDTVVLQIDSNWGSDEFTCVYRVRVHGDE